MRKLAFFVPIFCAVQFASALTVWIDTDVSIGSPIREVDDAYALILAFHSPEIRIAGLSTTYGNAPLGHTTGAAQNLVRRFGGDAGLTVADVYPGARSAADLDRRSAASEVLAATLRKQKITYIGLGPLTNLATFLRLHPELAHRIESVIFLGGQSPGPRFGFGPKESFHIHDANVFKDPAATEAVLRSTIPITLVPVATSSTLLIDAADLRQLEASGGAANYLSRKSRIWLWFWKTIVKTKGGPIFDAAALLPATTPGLVASEKRYATMDKSGNLLVRSRRTDGGRAVTYCRALAPETKRFVLRRLMSRRSSD